MLPTRNPSQDKRLTQTESERLETNFPSKRTRKKVGVAILISDKIDFQRREKQEVTYKGAPIKLAADFSMETHQTRREWKKYSK